PDLSRPPARRNKAHANPGAHRPPSPGGSGKAGRRIDPVCGKVLTTWHTLSIIGISLIDRRRGMLARRRVRSSVVLLVLLFIGVAVVGALTAGTARDLLHRDIANSGDLAATYVWSAKPEDISNTSVRYTILAVGESADQSAGLFASGAGVLPV